MTSYNRGIFTLSAHQKPTVGDTKTSVQNLDHLGWLRCDGRQLSKKDFYFLWSVIGYNFGGLNDSFNLPDAKGKIPGFKGLFNDVNDNEEDFIFASTIGTYKHRLTIAEMPSHNHGIANSAQISSNNLTSLANTNLSVNDPGHTHTITNNRTVQSNNINTVTALDNSGSSEINNIDTLNATNATNTTGITLTDPTHSHVLNSAGGDSYHNNIQPTIVIGNLFIYSGKPNYPSFSFPYKKGTNIL